MDSLDLEFGRANKRCSVGATTSKVKDARYVISIKWGENTEYFSTQSIILDCSRCYIKQLLMGVHYQLDVFSTSHLVVSRLPYIIYFLLF